MREPWVMVRGDSPLVAVAVHAGHDLRPEVAARMELDQATRRREEDPFTDRWTVVAPTRLVAHRSRFEVDLNRPPEGAVYLRPADAWGLEVWRSEPPADLVARSLEIHASFYAALRQTLTALVERHGRAVVLDLHSYNHRRGGPEAPPDPPEANPEINVGTGSMPERWRPLVDELLPALRRQTVGGRRLDVRENVRFRGGHLPAWIHRTFPDHACALAIEVKKTFMDEWTGEPQEDLVAEIGSALGAAATRLEAASVLS